VLSPAAVADAEGRNEDDGMVQSLFDLVRITNYVGT
jgi:hypothetical protein